MANQGRLHFEVYEKWVRLENRVDEFDEEFRVDQKTSRHQSASEEIKEKKSFKNVLFDSQVSLVNT